MLLQQLFSGKKLFDNRGGLEHSVRHDMRHKGKQIAFKQKKFAQKNAKTYLCLKYTNSLLLFNKFFVAFQYFLLIKFFFNASSFGMCVCVYMCVCGEGGGEG